MTRRKLLLTLLALPLLKFFPSKSVACESTENQVPVSVIAKDGSTVLIDKSIAPLVDSLNKGGIKTITSCCGHGRTDGYVLCDDRLLIVSKEQGEDARKRYESDFSSIGAKNENRRKLGKITE